jgi:hypothetical protein
LGKIILKKVHSESNLRRISFIGFMLILLFFPSLSGGMEFSGDYEGVLMYVDGSERGVYKITEFDLEKKESRTVGEFEASSHLYSVATSHEGDYFFYAIPKGNEDVIGALKKGVDSGVFEKEGEVVVGKRGFCNLINLVYDDWGEELYINYFVFEEPASWEPGGPPLIDYEYERIYKTAYVDINRKPYLIKTCDSVPGPIVAVSERYLYFITKENGDYYLGRRPRTSHKAEKLLEMASGIDIRSILVFNGEQRCVVEVHECSNEGDAFVLYHVNFNEGCTTGNLRAPFFVLPGYFHLNSVQGISPNGVLLETDEGLPLSEYPYHEVALLTENGTVNPLISFKRTEIEGSISGVASWYIGGINNSGVKTGFVNNASFALRPVFFK